jgi:molecular chaperone IbpA
MLDNSPRPDWPPYNSERSGENQYRISMAIAGFGPDEIELTQQGNTLWVSGQKGTQQDNQEILHRGLAFRSFNQSFSLADHLKVTAANLENGLLAIDLVREVPEQLKPRRIEVVAPAASLSRQGRPAEISHGIGAERKAA